jgi:hypothetical protein
VQHAVIHTGVAVAAAALSIAVAAPAASASTVDLTLSCASSTVSGTPTVQLQFIAGYQQPAAWLGIVQSSSGTLQLAQVGAAVPPIYTKSRCRKVRTKVSLAPRGLVGPASPLDTFVTCQVSSRVLVHIHAVTAGRRVVTATAVVRTLKGAPVAWAAIGKNGKGKILTSARCSS